MLHLQVQGLYLILRIMLFLLYIEKKSLNSWIQIIGGIRLIFFLFLIENIHCWYSLEAPLCGASNKYLQYMFSMRNKKHFKYF